MRYHYIAIGWGCKKSRFRFGFLLGRSRDGTT